MKLRRKEIKMWADAGDSSRASANVVEDLKGGNKFPHVASARRTSVPLYYFTKYCIKEYADKVAEEVPPGDGPVYTVL